MKKKEISDKVLAVFKTIIKDNDLNTNFDEEIMIGIDSISFVELVVELENMFDIEFDDEDFELEKMRNIDQITELIAKYLNR